jgi:hypothetical protein
MPGLDQFRGEICRTSDWPHGGIDISGLDPAHHRAIDTDYERAKKMHYLERKLAARKARKARRLWHRRQAHLCRSELL